MTSAGQDNADSADNGHIQADLGNTRREDSADQASQPQHKAGQEYVPKTYVTEGVKGSAVLNGQVCVQSHTKRQMDRSQNKAENQ